MSSGRAHNLEEVKGAQVELGHVSRAEYELKKVNASQRQGIMKALKHFGAGSKWGGQLEYDSIQL